MQVMGRCPPEVCHAPAKWEGILPRGTRQPPFARRPLKSGTEIPAG